MASPESRVDVYKRQEVTFSKVILIFLYYTFINRFVKKSDIPYAKTRYIMYGMIEHIYTECKYYCGSLNHNIYILSLIHI